MAEETEEMQLEPLLADDDTLDDLEKDTDIAPIGPQRPMLQRRPHRQRWLLITSVIVLVVLAGGGALLYWRLTTPPPVQFTQAQVTSGNLSIKIAATGPVGANAIYNMNFATIGQVREINVQVGQKVKPGQILAKLTVDTTTLQDNITQAQLGVTSAQNSLNAAQTSFSNAQGSFFKSQTANNAALNLAKDQEQTDLNNCNNPSSGGSAGTPTANPTPSASCIQTAKDKYAQQQAQLSASNSSAANSVTSSWNQVVSAQDGVSKANLQLQSAQHALDTANANANLISPTNATVAIINGAIGQNVSSGGSSSSSTTTSGFIVLTDTSKMSIQALVNEADIGNVQPGQSAQFTVAAFPGSTFRATVNAIETIGQTTSNVVNYPVLLNIDQASLGEQHLYPGMTATVNITTAQRIGTLLIPSSALSFPTVALQNGEIARSSFTTNTNQSSQNQRQQGQQSQNNKTRIVLQLKDGKLVPVTITTGLSNGQFTEVLSGLSAGDQVVTGQTGGKAGTNSTSGTNTRGTGGGTGGGTGRPTINFGG